VILGIAELSQSCRERRDGQHSQSRPFYDLQLTRGYLETSRYTIAKVSLRKDKTEEEEKAVYELFPGHRSDTSTLQQADSTLSVA